MVQPRFVLSMMITAALWSLALPVLSSSPAQAQEATTPVTAPAEKTAPTPPADPALAKLEKRSIELVDSLKEEELKHLFHIRESFGSTRAVKVVRGDVQNAVKACASANPEMKEKMEGRFAAWSGSIDPVVKAKEKETDAAIAAQTYLKPKEIKDYLKMIEKAADNVDKDITKVPVTTVEACEGLLKSMDNTEVVLTELIKGMALAPWPPVAEEPAPKITPPNN